MDRKIKKGTAQHPAATVALPLLLLPIELGVPRHILHELLGAGHPSRGGERGFGRKRCLFGVADNGSRVFLGVHMLEQLGHDESDFQPATRTGIVATVLFFLSLVFFFVWADRRTIL